MKKVAFVLLGLSMAFLVGCQTKGECDSCGDNEKLYYISDKAEGKEQNEDKDPQMCKECAEEYLELLEAFNEGLEMDHKLKIKKYCGE